ncbi:erythromycin esterase family protein [Kitasatospora sp. NPDC048365]|uniref:erythromycin esterase family protein n=1 Tax=Kitasatospora sp. NPDC048365 TaxID=3364050 RepID=UPI003715FB73
MTDQLQDATRPYSPAALTSLLSPDTRVLALGEPTHGVDAFLDLRNELLAHLVEHEGYRSVAIESDCLAALTADAYVTEGTGDLDTVMATGFSHGFGASAANRSLLTWMRDHNETCAPEDRVRFHGVDGPLEITGAASPRPALTALRDHLSTHLGPAPVPSADTLDTLLGPDDRWTHPNVMTDPGASPGRTDDARELRLLADDLQTLLTAHAPQLLAAASTEAHRRAELYARTATGLLRYHAALADTSPHRIATLLGLRATMMADNLDAVLRADERRGRTLVFAHNAHLQRNLSSLTMGGTLFEWWSLGAILSARLGTGYAFAATTFGTRNGTDTPAPTTLEGILAALPHPRTLVDPRRLATALDRQPDRRTPADHTYFPLDPATTDLTDAIVFLREI